MHTTSRLINTSKGGVAALLLLQFLLAATKALATISPASALSATTSTSLMAAEDGLQGAEEKIDGMITSSTSDSAESLEVKLLPADFKSSLTQMLFPKGITPGIAAQLFSVGEWILTVLSGLLFLHLLRLMMVARILHLPRTLRQTIVTAQRITEGMAGGIGSFARLIYDLFGDCDHKGRGQIRVTAVAPLAAYMLLVGGIILVNISQLSLENVLLTVQQSGTVSLSTAGWLMNGSLAETTAAEQQKRLLVSGAGNASGYYVTDVRRLWAPLSPNGYYPDLGLYVKDGVICLRPSKGLPPQKDVQYESIAYCEGFTATCSALQSMEVRITTSKLVAGVPVEKEIHLVDAKPPSYITDKELWRSTIKNISLSLTEDSDDLFGLYGTSTTRNPKGDGFFVVPETISVLVASSWNLPLSEDELRTATGGSKIIVGQMINGSLESFALVDKEYLLPGGGFAYTRLAPDGGKSPVYGIWIGQCDVKLRRGLMAPARPNRELPVVRNWTLGHLLTFDRESYNYAFLSALRVAVTADSEIGTKLFGVNGKDMAEKILAREVSTYFLSLSSGQPGQDIRTTATWEIRESRLLANMLWATLGLGVYVLLACVALVLWLYARSEHHCGDKTKHFHARQMAENCTSIWGIVRGIVLLAPAVPLQEIHSRPRTEPLHRKGAEEEEFEMKAGGDDLPPVRAALQGGNMALDSEKAVLREAKDWECEPVLLACEDKYEPRRVAAIKLKRREPFQH